MIRAKSAFSSTQHNPTQQNSIKFNPTQQKRKHEEEITENFCIIDRNCGCVRSVRNQIPLMTTEGKQYWDREQVGNQQPAREIV